MPGDNKEQDADSDDPGLGYITAEDLERSIDEAGGSTTCLSCGTDVWFYPHDKDGSLSISPTLTFWDSVETRGYTTVGRVCVNCGFVHNYSSAIVLNSIKRRGKV